MMDAKRQAEIKARHENDKLLFGELPDSIKDEWEKEIMTHRGELLDALERTCEWTDEGEFWSTSCTEDWVFIEDGPTENNVRFCQGCGGKVAIKEQGE